MGATGKDVWNKYIVPNKDNSIYNPWAAIGGNADKRAQSKDFLTAGLFKFEDKKLAKDASNQQLAYQKQQDANAKTLLIQTAQQPKQITPDNFLANKNAQLNKLRLGFASTMSGAGSLALPANPGGKAKLGL